MNAKLIYSDYTNENRQGLKVFRASQDNQFKPPPQDSTLTTHWEILDQQSIQRENENKLARMKEENDNFAQHCRSSAITQSRQRVGIVSLVNPIIHHDAALFANQNKKSATNNGEPNGRTNKRSVCPMNLFGTSLPAKRQCQLESNDEISVGGDSCGAEDHGLLDFDFALSHESASEIVDDATQALVTGLQSHIGDFKARDDINKQTLFKDVIDTIKTTVESRGGLLNKNMWHHLFNEAADELYGERLEATCYHNSDESVLIYCEWQKDTNIVESHEYQLYRRRLARACCNDIDMIRKVLYDAVTSIIGDDSLGFRHSVCNWADANNYLEWCKNTFPSSYNETIGILTEITDPRKAPISLIRGTKYNDHEHLTVSMTVSLVVYNILCIIV